MKANELMIGDWVCIGGPNYYQIDEIRKEFGKYRFYFKELSVFATESELEPIPLTTEILEKNGFDVSDREVMYYYFTLEEQKEYFALKQMYDKETKEPKGFSYFVCNVLTIFDYVHQLQHALRLVGLTELADRFKV